MRRDVGQLILAGLLLLLGYAMNARWNTHVGGWREACAVIGGVVFVAMLILLPVAVIATTIRHTRRNFVKPS